MQANREILRANGLLPLYEQIESNIKDLVVMHKDLIEKLKKGTITPQERELMNTIHTAVPAIDKTRQQMWEDHGIEKALLELANRPTQK